MADPSAPIAYHVLSMPADVERWHYVHDFLKLRKAVFIDRLHWPLHSHEGAEFEQYDHFGATYIVAIQNGAVVGGARLLRTDQHCHCAYGSSPYSYMIRDAARGMLDGLRIQLDSGEAPQDPAIWEITRLISIDNAQVGRGLIEKARTFLVSQGARECLFIGPPSYMRLARIMGREVVPLGPVMTDETGRFLPFSCKINQAGRHPGNLVNVGRARLLHMGGDTIYGTTYEWSLTGEAMTIWHENPGTTELTVVPA